MITQKQAIEYFDCKARLEFKTWQDVADAMGITRVQLYNIRVGKYPLTQTMQDYIGVAHCHAYTNKTGEKHE